MEHKTTPDELRRLLLVRLENYRAIMAACAGGDRWYFVARIDDVLTELARLDVAPEGDAIAGSVLDPSVV